MSTLRTSFIFRFLGIVAFGVCLFNLFFVVSHLSHYLMRIERQTMGDILRMESELIATNKHTKPNLPTTVVLQPITNDASITSDAHCLVVISGSIRAWQLTYLSFFEHLLDAYHCDLALSIGNTPHINHSNPLYKRAKYIWMHNFDSIGYEAAIREYYYSLMDHESYDDWLHKYKELKREHAAEHFMGPLWSTSGVTSVGSSGIGIVNRYFTALNILKYNLTTQYKAMVYTRSDFKYTCNHSDIPFDYTQYESNTVWIPFGIDYDGVYDRHFVSSPRAFVTINSLLRDMIMDETYFEELQQLNDSVKWLSFLNSEQMLKLHMDRNDIGIKRYPRSMFLVRGNDTTTRWREGFYSDIEQVYIKYIPEYRHVLRYCYNPLNGTLENRREFRKRMTPVHPNKNMTKQLAKQ
eukprot:164492_1